MPLPTRFARVATIVVALAAMIVPPAVAQQKPIVIGAALSLSGIFSDGGHYSLEGYQLWIKQQNAKGGLLGRQVELKYYDDQSDGATAVRLYRRLIDEDHVDLIVGPYGTALSAPSANVAAQYKMPMILPETADVAMFGRGNAFIVQGLGPVQTYLFGMLQIAKDHGAKTIAVVGGDTAFPHSLANAVPEVERGFGMSTVYQEFYPASASDLSSVVQKTRQANPDVLLAMAFPNDSVVLLRNMKQAGYAPKIFYEAIGPSDPQFEKNVGKDGEYVFTATNWNADNPSAENRAFITAYRAEFHREPDYHAASNYSALMVIGAAVTKAGSLDQQKINDNLHTMQVHTLLGEYRVNPRTGVQLGYTSFIAQWQKGHLTVVYPRNAPGAKPAVVPFPAWSTPR
ncbi:MAG: amino acid ABC transporter substrate-binding protein [Candidatus Eremiobacteraeota bacterium]|nr:amino acid ABC transporter substrate-binding protein [Candidatus Eremiobacteraeota bacterium]